MMRGSGVQSQGRDEGRRRVMQQEGNKCNPSQLKEDAGVEVKGRTGPVKSSCERYT